MSRFVDDFPTAPVFVRDPWRHVLSTVFGHGPRFIVAEADGHPVEVLPMYLIKHAMLGSKLVSVPYDASHGGFLGEEPAVRNALAKKCLEVAEGHGVRSVEIRSDHLLPELAKAGFSLQTPLLVSIVSLHDRETNWQALSRNHRRNVRSAKKRGVEIRAARSIEEVRVFYRIVEKHYHDLGVPFPARHFFEEIWRRLVPENHAHVQLALKNNQIIGGHLMLVNGDEIVSKYSACIKDKDLKKAYTSYALFWEAIRFAVDGNYSRFNLGVTGPNNQGLLEFKNRFGADTGPVFFYYYQFRGNATDYSEYYGKYKFVKRIWSLTPSLMTTPLGHEINRWIC